GRARETLQDLLEGGGGNPRDGVLLEYVNPVDGSPTFPSMNNCLRMVPGKSRLEETRRTENIVFVTKEGSVTFHLPDGQDFRAEPFDVIAIPSWVPYSISNEEREPAVLFSNSDRP